MRSACLAPEILKPRRRQLRVPDRMLNVAVTEVSLDRSGIMSLVGQGITAGMPIPSVLRVHAESDIRYTQPRICLLYTSDAADDLTRVDLGGRRIIKKKK